MITIPRPRTIVTADYSVREAPTWDDMLGPVEDSDLMADPEPRPCCGHRWSRDDCNCPANCGCTDA